MGNFIVVVPLHWNNLKTSRSHPRGGELPGCTPQIPKNLNLKNTDFVDIMISKVYLIYLSAKISH
jgi:hypothetical protein